MTGAVVRAGRTLVVCRGEAFGDGATVPFAVMQATLTAVYGRQVSAAETTLSRPGVAGFAGTRPPARSPALPCQP